jgi:Zn-dependent protease
MTPHDGFRPLGPSSVLELGTTGSPGSPGETPGTWAGGTQDAQAILDTVRVLEAKQGGSLNNALLLVVTLVLFLSLGLFQQSMAELVLLVLVLAIHEAGHFVAMRVAGYRDVQMFFIPLFGAAVRGREGTAPSGLKKTLVALAGPLPGILLAVPCAAVAALTGNRIAWQFAATLLFINVFNLLPFLPLDGGHVVQETLFSRSAWAEKAFRLLAVLGLALIAWVLGSWMLGALALFSLLGVPFANSSADAARSLRAAGVLPDCTSARDATLGFIERAMPLLEFDARGRGRQPKEIAVLIQQVVPRLATSPPSAGATTLLVGVYLAALVIAFLAFVVLAVATRGG